MSERFGLEILRPRERRRPQMPNAIAVLIEHRIVAFALGRPDSGPARIAAELAREKHGGLAVSANSVYRVLRRHGIHTRRPCATVCSPATQRRRDRRGSQSPSATSRWVTPASSCRWTGSASAAWPAPGDRRGQCLHLGRAARHAAQPRRARRQRARPARRTRPARGRLGAGTPEHLDNGSEFRNHPFDEGLARLGARHTVISPGRPQSNGFVERMQRTILEECGKPSCAATWCPSTYGPAPGSSCATFCSTTTTAHTAGVRPGVERPLTRSVPLRCSVADGVSLHFGVSTR